MSDFKIVNKNAKVNPCYGLENFYITKEEIDSLLSGKKLYSTVNCEEYAITIEMAESEDKRVAIPSAEPKTGYWITTGRMFVELTGEQTVYEVICDQCKGLSYFRRVTSVLFGADYCPNCGAKMEVDNDV